MQPQNRRYSPELIMLAFSIFVKSRSAYQALSKFFYLPTTRSLQNYSSSLSLSVKNDSCNFDYLKGQISLLKEHEKLITLKIDEIQIKPTLELRGGIVEGYSSNRPDELACHVQAFMINSLLCSYKEMIKLIPVSRNTTESLYNNLLQVLDLIENIGFKVVCITSDNNRINRNCFDKLRESPSSTFFMSRVHQNSCIFLLFDAPHMVKCIRNNWINLRNDKKEFIFPPFKKSSFGTSASFDHIKEVYHLEKEKNIRLGFKLNESTIFPSSIQRQKVPLALNIFDETTSSAVSSLVVDSTSTCNFLGLVNKFWKIFNINNPKKGFYKNDAVSLPFRTSSDQRLDFLSDLADWLDAWKDLKSLGKLSLETFHSVSFSCRSLRSIIIYLLDTLKFEYVLTSKLQTDCLESLFGVYRQMNGSSMLLTWFQVMSAEKKNRVMNSLSLRGTVLKLNDSDYRKESQEILRDFDSLDLDFCKFEMFDKEESAACVYIGGYIQKKYLEYTSCQGCLQLFSSEIENDQNFDEVSDYLRKIDRGKMTYPPPCLVMILLLCQRFFSLYIEDSIKISDQKINVNTLVYLFNRFLDSYEFINNLNYCYIHPELLYKNLKFVLVKFSKILLNNFSKKIMVSFQSDKKHLAKKSKHGHEPQIDKFYS